MAVIFFKGDLMHDTHLIEQTLEHCMNMLEQGKTKQAVLAHLTCVAEESTVEGAVVSILVLDNKGLLRNGASPKLPKDYLAAIDKLKPQANLGTCAAAAATGKMVLTPSFMTDDKWPELRHLPMALGFVGAWSMPILDPNGKVLGTFGTYFREEREPTQDEIDIVKMLSDVAAKVIMYK
jgi:GAF domain-containing protein